MDFLIIKIFHKGRSIGFFEATMELSVTNRAQSISQNFANHGVPVSGLPGNNKPGWDAALDHLGIYLLERRLGVFQNCIFLIGTPSCSSCPDDSVKSNLAGRMRQAWARYQGRDVLSIEDGLAYCVGYLAGEAANRNLNTEFMILSAGILLATAEATKSSNDFMVEVCRVGKDKHELHRTAQSFYTALRNLELSIYPEVLH